MSNRSSWMRYSARLISAHVIALSAFAAHGWAADQANRQLGAHEHGHGTLNIAIEGAKLTMELEVPGADIVGFEHAATTPEQKAAIEKAKVTLANPLELFKLPAAAQCRVTTSKVEIENGPGDHDQHAPKHKPEAAVAKDEAGHGEFHAEYTLECAVADKIQAIDFTYFQKFEAARELGVTVIGPKGQSQYDVTRAKPRIELTGTM